MIRAPRLRALFQASLSTGVKRLITGLVLLGLLPVATIIPPAQACVICIPFPTRTIADFIGESESVVLARENPDKPWTYRAFETLKGDTLPGPIDLFINSATRRQLMAFPKRGVVLYQDPEKNNEWRSLGFADTEYEALLREIIQRAPAWHQQGLSNDARLNFFAPYLGHKNRKIHELAYLEIGRASYTQIRQLDTGWSLAQMRALVNNPRYVEWHALAILMLAFRGDETDRARVRERFAARARSGLTTNLSAWATALVEIRGAAAVTEIESSYFQAPERSKEELIEVVLALSEHGNYGQTHLRDTIIPAYSTLLEYHPQMAAFITRDLMTWQRWELTDQLQSILGELEATDDLAAYAIKLYLGQAKNAGNQKQFIDQQDAGIRAEKP